MSDCVFCKIANGELPLYKTYEDGLFLGFLDINPLAPGNILLIPKNHYRWVTDVPEFGLYWEAARKCALAAQKVVGSDYTTFATFGTDIEHAHIRIIPRFYKDIHGEGLNTSKIVKIKKDKMVEIAQNIFDSII